MHSAELEGVEARLIEVENIEQAEYETIILAFGIMPKKKKSVVEIVK